MKEAFLWGVWLSVSHAIQTIHSLVARCAYRIVTIRLGSSTCGHRKLVFLVRTPNPVNRTEPHFDFPLPTAASSSRFALLRSHSTMNP